jgi:hypothetical protein
MQVIVILEESDLYEIRADLPDTVDTSAWTREDWHTLGLAMARARFDDRDDLEQIAGDIDVSGCHVDNDSEIEMVELGNDVVFNSRKSENAMALRNAFATIRAWAEDKPGGEEVLQIIDKVIWRCQC